MAINNTVLRKYSFTEILYGYYACCSVLVVSRGQTAYFSFDMRGKRKISGVAMGD